MTHPELSEIVVEPQHWFALDIRYFGGFVVRASEPAEAWLKLSYYLAELPDRNIKPQEQFDIFHCTAQLTDERAAAREAAWRLHRTTVSMTHWHYQTTATDHAKQFHKPYARTEDPSSYQQLLLIPVTTGVRWRQRTAKKSTEKHSDAPKKQDSTLHKH